MANDNKKKGLDAFAGRKVGGDAKYRAHHLEALRIERAKAAEQRIKDFYNQAKTLDWSRRAMAFCDEEEAAAKEYADICGSLDLLPKIRREAQIRIDEENDRLRKIEEEKEKKRLEEEAKEKERLRQIEEQKRIQAEKEAEQKRQLELMKQQQELKEMAEEQEFVADIEKIISSLSKDVRNEAWVDGVKNTHAIATGLEKRVYDKIKNRFLLEGFVKEIEDVELAIDIDDEIIDLQNAKNKNKAWASKVFALEGELDGKHEKYLTQKPTYFKLVTLANKVYYASELSSLENFIIKVEQGQGASFVDELENVMKKKQTLADQILIEEFITGFDLRFQKAVSTVNDIIADRKRREKEAKEKAQKEEKERIRKQKAEEAERLRIQKEEERKAKLEAERLAKIKADEEAAEAARQRAKKEAERQAALKKARRRNLIEIISVSLVFVAFLVLGIITKNVTRSFFLGFGLVAVISYVYFRLAQILRNLDKESLRAVIFTILMIAEAILGVVFVFVDRGYNGNQLGIVTTALALGIIAQGLSTYFVGGNYLEDIEKDIISIFCVVAGALLGSGIFLMSGASIWSGLAGGIIVAAGAFVAIWVNYEVSSYHYDIGIFIEVGYAIMAVIGCILCLFDAWSLYILGAFFIVSSAVSAFLMGNDDIDGGYLVGSIASIGGLIFLIAGLVICLT